MSENAPRRYYDGFVALDGGIDSGRSPAIQSEANPNGLRRNQVSFAINATMRGCQIKQRPAYMQRLLVFANETDQTNFEEGRWQGASFYEADTGPNSLIAAIGGRLFQIQVENGFRVIDVSVPGDLNAANRLYSWFVQAENFLVVQDGIDRPIIFDGASSRRALPHEIKTGTVMAYAQGRIWYALPDGYSFRATDLVWSTPAGRAAVLQETENTFLNESGDFAVPGNSGRIRAMVVPVNLDTSLGQGPLQVFTTKGVFSVNAPVDRTAWKDVTYPIQTVSQLEYGALGSRSAIPVNGDIFYRSLDGVRSFALARRTFADWGNTPISSEMERVIKFDQIDLLNFSSAVLFENRFLLTAWPKYTDLGVYHRGLMALDFDLISSMGQEAPPAWEGVWTGLNILQIVKGTFGEMERCFLFVQNTDSEIELWEIVSSELFDNGVNRIVWSFESPAFDFRSPMSLKRLDTGTLFVQDINGRVDFNVKYRPDQHPCWIDWHTWSECATVEQCQSDLEGPCPTLENLKPQYRPKMRLPQPADYCSEATGMLYRDCFEAQMRVQVEGPATVKQGRLTAIDRTEPPYGECRGEGPCVSVACCLPDPIAYRADEAEPNGNGGNGGNGNGNGNGNGVEVPVYPSAVPQDCGGGPPLSMSLTWDFGGTQVSRFVGITDPTFLNPGVLEWWAGKLWEQFHATVVGTPTFANIVWRNDNNFPGPVWYANEAYVGTAHSVSYGSSNPYWDIRIEYCLT